ncbi:cag pathogenicity island Cag12 family protein [Klebsiella pneumoniae]|uniref:cag pathogenicity island Cag12 family protein n=2 Tax=Klebsiella pneumoniae TaxID=573 RepID=UPI00359D6F44
MIKQIKVIMLAAIVTGCSSPPPPVPVDWDKAAAPLNTSLPQWSDNNVMVPSPTVNSKWTSSISAQSFYNTIQYNMDSSRILRSRPLNTNCRHCTIRH